MIHSDAINVGVRYMPFFFIIASVSEAVRDSQCGPFARFLGQIPQQLIARGARIAHGLDAEFYVVHVETGKGRPPERDQSLATNIRFAENLGAKFMQIKGSNVAKSVGDFIREYKITQVIFGRSAVHGWRKYLYLNAIQRLLARATAVDVHIVTQEPH